MAVVELLLFERYETETAGKEKALITTSHRSTFPFCFFLRQVFIFLILYFHLFFLVEYFLVRKQKKCFFLSFPQLLKNDVYLSRWFVAHQRRII